MSDEHDAWFKDAFGVDIGRSAEKIKEGVETIKEGVETIKEGVKEGVISLVSGDDHVVAGGSGITPHQDPIHRERDKPPAPPQPKGPVSSNMPTLREGSSGPAVKDLQMLLNQNGASLTIDGQFGPQTTKAVKAFQASAGLTADGVVGRQTWDALSAGKPVPPPPPEPPTPPTPPSPPTPPAPPEPPPTPPKPAPVIGITVVTVTNEATNDAISKAKVRIDDQEEATGNTGEATFSLPAGQHSFVVTADGFVEGSGKFNVKDDGDSDVHVELKPSGKPSGDHALTFVTLDEETQKPVPGAKVKIGDQNGVTDRKGELKIKLTEGSHPYSVTAEGFTDAKGTLDTDVEMFFELMKPLNRKSGSVLFSVADETNGSPIAGATITIGNESAKTAETGFVVFFTPAGNFPYQVSAQGFEDARGKIEIASDDEGEHLELMKPKGGGGKTGSIAITVADASTGDAVEGAMVDVNGEVRKTDTAGLAVFFMAPGSFPFKVTAEGFQDGGGNEVEVTAEGATFIEFLQPKGDSTGGLTVTVTDKATGNPIDGATVEVDKASSTTVKGGFGKVTFIGLKTGKHAFRVSAKGFKEERGNVEVKNDVDELTPPLRVQLVRTVPGPAAKKGKLTVQVVFSDPTEPVKGAVVSLAPVPVPPAPSVKPTNDKGTVDFDGLTPGKCVVTARTADGSGTATVTISADKLEVTTIVLPRKAGPPVPPPKPTLKEKIEALIRELRQLAQSLLDKVRRAKELLERVGGPCKLKALAAAAAATILVGSILAFIAAIAGDAVGVGEIIQAATLLTGIGSALALVVALSEVETCLETQLREAEKEGNAPEVERLRQQIKELKDLINGIRNDATRVGNLINLIKNLGK